jgi:hypothetical protein
LEDNIKMDFRNRVGCELDTSRLKQEPVLGSCELDIEPLGSKRWGIF